MPTARSSRGSALGRSPWRSAIDQPPIGKYKASAVSNHLGNLQPFLPKGPARGECAQLGMALGEVGTGAHGRQESLAKALMAPRPLEGYHGLPEAVDRPRIVALSSVA